MKFIKAILIGILSLFHWALPPVQKTAPAVVTIQLWDNYEIDKQGHKTRLADQAVLEFPDGHRQLFVFCNHTSMLPMLRALTLEYRPDPKRNCVYLVRYHEEASLPPSQVTK